MSDKTELIDAEYASLPAGNGHAPTITCMCRWLGVSKSGFYGVEVTPGKRNDEKAGKAQAG